MRATAIAIIVVAAAAALLASSAPGRPVKGAPDCRIFPKDNQWNLRVDNLPLHQRSAAMVRSIGLGEGLHPDFGSGKYNGARIGIPYTTVSKNRKKVDVKFGYAGESDKGPYPIPSDVPIEGGRQSSGDRHALIVDRDRCKLYELYRLFPPSGGKGWRAGSGAIWSLRSNKVRKAGDTSADAAGLPILPGLARREELKKGGINHALRFTVSRTRRAYVWPARHFASSLTDASPPPMGLRLRLKAGYDSSGLAGQARAVAQALKTYGALVADNSGGNPDRIYISGSADVGWDDDDLAGLKQIPASALEAVQTGPVIPGH
jgi:hypothetical protein